LPTDTIDEFARADALIESVESVFEDLENRTRRRRIAKRVVTAFAAFLVLIIAGNALIMGSVLWFRWTGAGASPAGVSIDNFRIVDDHVWRGAAPGDQGLREVAALGATTIVDLRAEDALDVNDTLIRELGLTRYSLPVRDGQLPSADQAAAFLDIVANSDGPVFLHCGAGIGRSGAMTAFYLNATGQAGGTGALRHNLSVGPPSLEQIVFSMSTSGGDYDRPGVLITAASRLLDSPRRIWHNLT